MDDNKEPPTDGEAVIGLLMWIFIIWFGIFLMSSCGGCWDAGTHLFWH